MQALEKGEMMLFHELLQGLFHLFGQHRAQHHLSIPPNDIERGNPAHAIGF